MTVNEGGGAVVFNKTFKDIFIKFQSFLSQFMVFFALYVDK